MTFIPFKSISYLLSKQIWNRFETFACVHMKANSIGIGAGGYKVNAINKQCNLNIGVCVRGVLVTVCQWRTWPGEGLANLRNVVWPQFFFLGQKYFFCKFFLPQMKFRWMQFRQMKFQQMQFRQNYSKLLAIFCLFLQSFVPICFVPICFVPILFFSTIFCFFPAIFFFFTKSFKSTNHKWSSVSLYILRSSEMCTFF